MGGSVARRQSTGTRNQSGFCLSLLLAACTLDSCTFLPSEFNLSPIFRQRLDEDGNVAELDFLWPIFHYEVTPSGGVDFRIRPFYRYLEEEEQVASESRTVTEQQFIWPLGMTRSDGEESYSRLFPLWRSHRRLNDQGQWEKDWYFLFPFIWGGKSEDGSEDYFGVFPLYGDFPDFLTYERFQFILFPFYLGLEKDERISNIFLWPFIGYGHGGEGSWWHRFLPLYSYAVDPSYRRYSFLWPFFSWGTEELNSGDPISQFFFWPIYGFRQSEKLAAWTFLWPFFKKVAIQDELFYLDILWPIFRYNNDRREANPIFQWWFWPLVAQTVTNRQRAWNFLWPLIWLREYDDPNGTDKEKWFLPFYWQIDRERVDGSEDRHRRIWPLYSSSEDELGRGEWRAFSLWPWRLGNDRGTTAAYSWLWTIAEGRKRAIDDESFNLAAHLYTSRTRGERKQASVPLLFNYESDSEGSVLRLFQFIPIWFGSGSGDPQPDDETGGR
ncbi:MAG: hypothetical protein ACYTG5_00345 [Planctomycetota bacterium]|jgi:hypothetical protein